MTSANGDSLRRLRVLFVPDSIHWATGTIAKSIARHNPWIEATIASSSAIEKIFNERPDLIHNFDLVHFICPYASKYWMPRWRELIPCVTSHHHVTNWEWVRHNVESDAIVVGSQEWSDDLRARGSEMSKVFVVPYGVDTELFQPATTGDRRAIRKRLRIDDGAVVVGFFGKNSSNDDDRKGTRVFMEAVKRLQGLIPELCVLLIGPGWHELRASIESVGVRSVCVPFVAGRKNLSRMYRALDFYWVTATVEGGPVTLLEAMSSGLCCLTTPVGLANEVVRDGENAFLLEFKDPEGFAQRTLTLAHCVEERKRLGRNARLTMLEMMSDSKTTQLVHAVYSKALENFASRTGTSALPSVSATERSFSHVAIANEDNDRVPRTGFPKGIQKRVGMLETLGLCKHMIALRERRVFAVTTILREWLKNPLSLEPPRVMLQGLLPVSIVELLVRTKYIFRRTPLNSDSSVRPS